MEMKTTYSNDQRTTVKVVVYEHGDVVTRMLVIKNESGEHTIELMLTQYRDIIANLELTDIDKKVL